MTHLYACACSTSVSRARAKLYSFFFFFFLSARVSFVKNLILLSLSIVAIASASFRVQEEMEIAIRISCVWKWRLAGFKSGFQLANVNGFSLSLHLPAIFLLLSEFIVPISVTIVNFSFTAIDTCAKINRTYKIKVFENESRTKTIFIPCFWLICWSRGLV